MRESNRKNESETIRRRVIGTDEREKKRGRGKARGREMYKRRGQARKEFKDSVTKWREKMDKKY